MKRLGGWEAGRLGALICVACGTHSTAPHQNQNAPLSMAADATMVPVPAGKYVAGSTPEERNQAYDDYLDTAGKDAAREGKWFESEEDRHLASIDAFRIDLLPVTNAEYAEFVTGGGAPAPTMDEATWKAQGFSQSWDQVQRFVWQDGRPPAGREDHPVVLVTYDQAAAYCAWRGQLAGAPRRLPTAAEYEDVARGTDGDVYPWGNTWDATKLDCAVGGPMDTVAVGSHADAPSPLGVLDLAGDAFAWTSTPWPPGAGADSPKRTVKGSAWDDYAGVGRGASWHGRDRTIRHVIVGFRCAGDGA